MHNTYKTNETVYIIFDIDDVYVSYFISYLVAALKGLGINAVSDKTRPEQKNGLFFGVNLVLVVFSDTYTFSEACLKNLEELQKFREGKGHLVVPVFYEESVSAIKEKIERRDTFAVKEKLFSVDQVAKWQRVLVETIELQGHDHDLSEESDFIDKIVEDIFDKLCPTEHIGNQKVIKELENLLCKLPWARRILGILGEAGMGKTTLVEAAFQKMSSSYDASYFIGFGNQEKIKLFSDEDFKEVPMEKFDLNQDSEPSQRPKRVLLILDDVQRVSDVKDFLVGYDRFGPGSLLIITSRHSEVLEQCHVNDIYELKGLSNEDSLKLFTRCVFEEDVDDVDEESLKFSMKEIKHCDGNPSAILSRVKKVMEEHNYESDLQKFPERDVANHMACVCASYLPDLPRFISLPRHVVDLRIPYIGPEFVPARLPYKIIPIDNLEELLIWQEPPMISQTSNDSTKTLLTNQIETKILNLRGCVEIKHVLESVQNIRECGFEGKILRYRLKRDQTCPHCKLANETGTHIFFNITSSWSILTKLKNRMKSWEVVLFSLLNLTGSMVKKIRYQMEWQLTVLQSTSSSLQTKLQIIASP